MISADLARRTVMPLARRTVMPATLAVALGVALAAMSRGVAVSAVLPLVLLASIVWVAWLERVLPYRPEWNRARGDLLADALYLPTTSLVAALMRPAVVTAGVGLASLALRALRPRALAARLAARRSSSRSRGRWSSSSPTGRTAGSTRCRGSGGSTPRTTAPSASTG